MTHKLKFFLASLILGFTMVLVAPEPALAGAVNDFGGVGAQLCKIVEAITGNIGRAIATIAVVFLGFGAFFGKVTWGLAVAVAVGIFAIFGASTIVSNFGDGGGACDATDATAATPATPATP